MKKMGSLFDGSGGFPLAAAMCGITPVFASEIKPYPIAVTTSRFPNVRHYGDVSKINGAEVEPVDIVTFGSPCQSLSVAGKREGLKHTELGDEETTRSGLFMESVRIIKEMREATNGILPRFAVWENVPGAFSSQRGEDFRTVLDELIKIVEPNASVPPMPKGGWPYADCYVGDGWSIAYRTYDAQYWGVPQRRRRIYLVADFGGECAGEILFKREGLRGYFETGRTPWQGIACNAERSVGATDREGEGFDGYNGDLTGAVAATLGVNCGMSTGRNGIIERGRGLDAVAFAQNQRDEVRLLGDKAGALQAQPGMKQQTFVAEPKAFSFDSLASNSMKSKNPHSGCREVTVAKTLDTTDPNPCKNQGGLAILQPVAFAPVAATLRAGAGAPKHEADFVGRLVAQPVCVDFGRTADRIYINPKTSVTLSSQGGGMGAKTGLYLLPADPVYCLQGNGIDRADTAGCNGKGVREDVCYTLNTIDRPAVAYAISSKQQSLATSEGKANTLGANDYKEPQVVAFDRAAFNQGQNALYSPQFYTDGTAPTLVAKGPSGVCHPSASFQTYQSVTGPLMANSHPGSYTGQDAFSDMLVAGKINGKDEQQAVLQTKPQYIVRRLTPTECARLQGFPDWWGHPTPKETLTDEEYRFWCKVLLEYAEVNGTARPNENGDYEIWRQVKPDKKKGEDFEPYWENTGKPYKHKTKPQMLTWYNKLHTDGAEYEMWGNGVALPNALHVMLGIADVLTRDKELLVDQEAMA